VVLAFPLRAGVVVAVARVAVEVAHPLVLAHVVLQGQEELSSALEGHDRQHEHLRQEEGLRQAAGRREDLAALPVAPHLGVFGPKGGALHDDV